MDRGLAMLSEDSRSEVYFTTDRANPVVMSKGMATRDAIVTEALAQATLIGLEGLSLGPLAEKLNLSKSGLFAHFKSKEALQVMVMQEAIARFRRIVVQPAAKAATPRAQLQKAFDLYVRWIVGTGPSSGCLFLTAIQEYDDRPGLVRDLLVASQQQWRDFLRGVVRAGIGAGDFRADADPDQAVFELIGAALSFQHSCKLLADRRASSHAAVVRDGVIARLSA